MDSEFWERAWSSGQTGFHKSEVHPGLVRHAGRLFAGETGRVLVPLCGRSLDMLWLEAQGHTVVGCELVESAVAGFFDEHKRTVRRQPHGSFQAWQSGRLTVLQGDVFELAKHPPTPPVTAVWDRAALVALPPERRSAYVHDVLLGVTAPGARILLNVLDYEISEMNGPPFAVPPVDVQRLFAGCMIEHLSQEDARETMSRPDRPLSRLDVHTWLITRPA